MSDGFPTDDKPYDDGFDDDEQGDFGPGDQSDNALPDGPISDDLMDSLFNRGPGYDPLDQDGAAACGAFIDWAKAVRAGDADAEIPPLESVIDLRSPTKRRHAKRQLGGMIERLEHNKLSVSVFAATSHAAHHESTIMVAQLGALVTEATDRVRETIKATGGIPKLEQREEIIRETLDIVVDLIDAANRDHPGALLMSLMYLCCGRDLVWSSLISDALRNYNIAAREKGGDGTET